MATGTYAMEIAKTLQFGIMVESASKMTASGKKDRLKEVAELFMASEKSVLASNHLIVTSQTVGKDYPFTFASVHRDLPVPEAVETVPMVVEIVFKEGVSDNLFVRIKNDLNFYDGVTAMHTGFQVLEYMEHGTLDKVSPFPFTGNNGGADAHNSLAPFLHLCGTSQ